MRFLIVAALLSTPVAAAEVYQLTPAQKEAAIASAALQPERTALLPAGDALPPSAEREAILGNSLFGETRRANKVHGEVGMFIGTGGARGIYGTTAVPLGETGVASFSFQSSRMPGWDQGYRLGRR